MKKLIFIILLLQIALLTNADMYVCYGNENNCFGSRGNCTDLTYPCGTAPGVYDPGNCNCTQLTSIIVVYIYDDYVNPRNFRINGDALDIANSEGSSWTTIYDLGVFDTDRAYTFRYVSALDIVVLDVYILSGIEDEISQGAPYNFSNALEETINISYVE